jgi:uncharacterized repeat protein (TIGR03803 family)
MKERPNLFLSAAAAVALAIILFTSVAVTVAHAETYTVLYNFGGVPGDPQFPWNGPIAQGRDGNLYATTLEGGTGSGTVFRITPTGTLTVLSSLGGDAGDNPNGGLTLGRNGKFYATAAHGGSGGWGTVFQITPGGKLLVLYSFSNDMNGSQPLAPPIEAADGNLYGTTRGDGDKNFGTIYKITPPLHLTTMYQFTGGADGGTPLNPLLQATDGSFYGTASNYAFKIRPAGTFTSLGPLPAYTAFPLIQAYDGSFYGTTAGGGTYNDGTVFQMTRNGKTKVIHNFNAGREENPSSVLVQASDGNFYGTTSSGGAWGLGTIYRMSSTGVLSVLHSFDGTTGYVSLSNLFQHTNGILYGETAYGGLYSSGTFYSLDIGAPPFVRLVTTFGKVGNTIGILGQGFTRATDVSFNGIPATFTVSSDTYLEATVPAGATTGFVTVTTSSGTLTSNQQIQIR